MYKLLIKEVLPGEISKGVGNAGQGSQAGVISGEVLTLPYEGTWNINYALEFLSPEGKRVGLPQ